MVILTETGIVEGQDRNLSSEIHLFFTTCYLYRKHNVFSLVISFPDTICNKR